MLFAYFGPETVMPIASVLAAIGGAILMFGRNILYFFKRLFRGVAGKKTS